jgi:ribosomal protein L24E
VTYTEQNTKVWLDLRPGDTCRYCNTRIERGHRYYEEEDGSVIHYCCLRQEKAEA